MKKMVVGSIALFVCISAILNYCNNTLHQFGQVQNLRKTIRINAELTKTFEQVQNLQKSIRTNA